MKKSLLKLIYISPISSATAWSITINNIKAKFQFYYRSTCLLNDWRLQNTMGLKKCYQSNVANGGGDSLNEGIIPNNGDIPSITPPPLQYWISPANNDYRIAYRYQQSSNDGLKTTVLFLNGLQSTMSSTKCHSLQRFLRQNQKANFLCFDYRGHGATGGGRFVDYTLRHWIDDARNILEDVILPNTKHNVILVGSSMGAWIALILALELPHHVRAIVGIASAVDFTHHVYQEKLTEDQRASWDREGENSRNRKEEVKVHYIRSPYLVEPYPFSRSLYEDGNNYLLCHNPPADSIWHTCEHNSDTSKMVDSVKLKCPVRLLHGMEDDVVHWSKAVFVEQVLRSKYSCEDISLKLLESADHRLSKMSNIDALLETLDELL